MAFEDCLYIDLSRKEISRGNIEVPELSIIKNINLSHNNFREYRFYFPLGSEVERIDLSFNSFKKFTFSYRYTYPKILDLSNNLLLTLIDGVLARDCQSIILKNCPSLQYISPKVLEGKSVVIDDPFHPELISGLWNCSKVNSLSRNSYRKKVRIMLLRSSLKDGLLKSYDGNSYIKTKLMRKVRYSS